MNVNAQLVKLKPDSSACDCQLMLSARFGGRQSAMDLGCSTTDSS